MKSVLLFLIRYWLYVIILPSTLIPTFFFFRDYTDFADAASSSVMYEITKYLVPAILIFMAGGCVIGLLAVLVSLFVIPKIVGAMSLRSFKSIFILMNAGIIATPFLMWYVIHQGINEKFMIIILPCYVISAAMFGLLLVNRIQFDSLRRD